MAQDRDVLELAAALVQIGKEDRGAFRTMRHEIWEMVRANHAGKTPEQIAAWSRNAS